MFSQILTLNIFSNKWSLCPCLFMVEISWEMRRFISQSRLIADQGRASTKASADTDRLVQLHGVCSVPKDSLKFQYVYHSFMPENSNLSSPVPGFWFFFNIWSCWDYYSACFGVHFVGGQQSSTLHSPLLSSSDRMEGNPAGPVHTDLHMQM